MPLELKYLPVLESGLNPLARSPAGATGLWQFMYNTARSQDLEINSWVDERRDPVEATEAACRFLKRLNDIYDGDWHSTLAAYNAGPGNVNKAIRRSGSRDFWTLRRFLPRETAKYVPSIVALTYLFSHPVEAGLVPSDPAIPAFDLDTVMVHRNVRFDQVSRATGRPVAEIAQLNPQYRKEVVPGAIGEGGRLSCPNRLWAISSTGCRRRWSGNHTGRPRSSSSRRSPCTGCETATCWAPSRAAMGFRYGNCDSGMDCVVT